MLYHLIKPQFLTWEWDNATHSARLVWDLEKKQTKYAAQCLTPPKYSKPLLPFRQWEERFTVSQTGWFLVLESQCHVLGKQSGTSGRTPDGHKCPWSSQVPFGLYGQSIDWVCDGQSIYRVWIISSKADFWVSFCWWSPFSVAHTGRALPFDFGFWAKEIFPLIPVAPFLRKKTVELAGQTPGQFFSCLKLSISFPLMLVRVRLSSLLE